jgi:pimeloyl-ACP methyl ester carboxylesterase
MRFSLVTLLFCIPYISSAQQNKSDSLDVKQWSKFVEYCFVSKNYIKASALIDSSLFAKFGQRKFEESMLQAELKTGKLINFEPPLFVDSLNKKYSQSIFYFEKNTLKLKIIFNSNHKISSFLLEPTLTKFKKNNHVREEYKIDGSKPIFGTLSYFDSSNSNKIIVVLVAGSGPANRDEIIGATPFFKNLSKQLDEFQISNYRFDKHTFTYPNDFTNDTYTIDDEYTNDLITIINHFDNDSIFRNYKIILLGHSLGASVIINKLKKINGIDGLLLLAPNTLSLDSSLLFQLQYLEKIDTSTTNKIIYESEIKKIRDLNSIGVSRDMNKMPLKIPYSYWKSIKNNNISNNISEIKIPCFIVFGNNDYQVTSRDFNIIEKCYKENKNITLKQYPNLNHLFSYSNKMSIPSDYLKELEVDSVFISDITNWILKFR